MQQRETAAAATPPAAPTKAPMPLAPMAPPVAGNIIVNNEKGEVHFHFHGPAPAVSTGRAHDDDDEGEEHERDEAPRKAPKAAKAKKSAAPRAEEDAKKIN